MNGFLKPQNVVHQMATWGRNEWVIKITTSVHHMATWGRNELVLKATTSRSSYGHRGRNERVLCGLKQTTLGLDFYDSFDKVFLMEKMETFWEGVREKEKG